jgi:WD40 repeat protein
VSAVALTPDGHLLASAGQDGQVLLWDLASASEVGRVAPQRLTGHHAAVRTLAFDRSAGLLAAGAEDGQVLVWDMTTRRVVQDIAGSARAVNVVVFAVDGQHLVAGDAQGRVQSWPVLR